MTLTPQQLSLGEVIKLKPERTLWLAQSIGMSGDFLVLFAVLRVASFKSVLAGVGYFFLPQVTHEKSGATT